MPSHTRPHHAPHFALLLAASALCACVHVEPQSIIRAEPSIPFRWQDGRAVVRSGHGQVGFAASFEADRGDHIEWLVVIENRSQTDIEVRPEKFFYRATDLGEHGPFVRAVEPNAALLEVDRRLAWLEASGSSAKKNEFGRELGTDLLRSMLGLEPLSSGEWDAVHLREEQARRSHGRSLHVQRAVLANQALRRTTLAPGGMVGGLVLFPRLEHAGETELILWVAGLQVRFPFKQALL